MKRMLERVWAALLELLFPSDVGCLCCGAALGEWQEDGLCPACVAALEAQELDQEADKESELPEGISAVYAAYPYDKQARKLILRLKYEGVRAAAVPLGKAMALLPGGEAELLVPVPTTRRRLRQRGFNQAALLCSEIARETGMPMAEALTRTEERRTQTRLSAEERRANLVGTMQADSRVRGKRIVLVDDVYTTGATAQEAARALHEAGAAQVFVFAAARTIFGLGQSETARMEKKPKKHAVS